MAQNQYNGILHNIMRLISDMRSTGHSPQHADILYRVVKLPCPNDPKLQIQIIGKNLTIALKPEEVMRDDMLLGFNKADIAIITHLGTRQEAGVLPTSKPRTVSRIVQQLFGKKTKFVVEDEQAQQHITSPEALFNDPSTPKSFDTQDGMAIGYAAAEEQLQRKMAQTHHKPVLRIISQITVGESKLIVEHIEKTDQQELDVEAIFYDKTIFCQFSRNDQAMIAFAAGELSKARQYNCNQG